MIFVTVGTHEQSFERLVKKVDELKRDKIIDEDVIIQKGYTDYEPRYCESYKLIGYNDMQKYLEDARIIITHGGPASFIAPLTIGKIPIVVPRQKDFNEHVNNHQKDFVEQVVARDNSIIPCYDIDDLEKLIKEYDSIVENMKENYKSNNKIFCEKLDEEIKNVFNK
jgi:Uncharacterized conserved protein